MKGVILAGGSGTRLYPATISVCKQLLPVFDKPMIYYPLSTLMLAGIRDILIISTPQDTPRFQSLLGDGSQLGLSLFYAIQKKPQGIAQALSLAAPYFSGENVTLILGDNLFFGDPFPEILRSAVDRFQEGATIFGYRVNNPSRYGVISFDEEGSITDIKEKPHEPASNYAVSGLYIYDANACKMVETLSPSHRDELEITDLNRLYLQHGQLQVKLLSKGIAWLDTGTMDALQKASLFVQTIQERQGIKIACIEEIAYQQGWIGEDQILDTARRLPNSYGEYLLNMLKEKEIRNSLVQV